MQDPNMAAKINKLIMAGIIKVAWKRINLLNEESSDKESR
jgi:hypothetical protein